MTPLRTPWRAVAAAFALNGMLLGAWASRVPAVVAYHGLSEALLGGFLLLLGAGALMAFPVAGRVADTLGAVRVTRVLAVAAAAALVLMGLAPDRVSLGLAILAFGVTYGGMDVTMNSWAAEVERHMGRAVMASFHAMWSLGAGLGAASGFAAVRLELTYSTQFALTALFLGLVLGPFIAAPWQSRRQARRAGAPVFAVPKGPLVLVGLVALSAGLGEGAMADWSAVFLHEVAATDQSRAALGYAAYAATMVAMRLCVDRLVMRYGPVRTARASGLCAACGLVLVAGVASFPAAMVGFVLMGVGYAAIIPLAFSRAAADPDIPAGEAIASVATLGYGAVLIGPPVIGFVAEASSLRVGFGLLGLFALAIAAFAFVLERPQPAEAAEV